MKQFALFFAALLCASLMAVSANATDYDDISVRVEAVTGDEYRVMIVNRSHAKSHLVTVEIYAGPYSNKANVVRRTIESAPSSAATVTMFKGGDIVAGAGVLIDGVDQRVATPIDLSRTNAWVRHSINRFQLLVSGDVETIGLMNAAAVDQGFKDSGGENDVSYLTYKSPMPEWSGNWLSYSGYDAVIISADELRLAPDVVSSALWRYVECGGSMVIIGDWEIPGQWRSRRVKSVEVEEEKSGVAWKKFSQPLPEAAQNYNVGFGNVTIIDAAGVKSILPEQWGAIKFGWKGSHTGGKAYRDIVDINKDFPVIERIGIPVRGLFVLMFMFVIVIGPINLIWLARRRRKIWMLWTVPAIALVTCLTVTGFALFSEGVSAMSRAESFTILDESSHRASTIGWMAFYAPLTPSEGLHFSYDTELTSVTPEVGYSFRRGGNRTIDLSNDQHLDSGWIMARVPVYFKYRKSETRRERLTIRQEGDGAISVVNVLGADIRELWLADRNGKVYSASRIRAGAEAKLSPSPLTLVENKAGLRELFTADDWLGKMKEVDANPQRFLAPGCYLAKLDASPFVEEGLKNVATRKGRALVYGISAPILEAGR